jgi:hypothetical protein
VLRFDLTLHLSWLAVPAMLLVALTTTTVGFAIAYAATAPVTNMATQLIVFIAVMFPPINYPPTGSRGDQAIDRRDRRPGYRCRDDQRRSIRLPLGTANINRR